MRCYRTRFVFEAAAFRPRKDGMLADFFWLPGALPVQLQLSPQEGGNAVVFFGTPPREVPTFLFALASGPLLFALRPI